MTTTETRDHEPTAARNRRIKATLERAFGRGKVRVRGGRGTAYGWVHIDIAHQPRDSEQAQELTKQCHLLMKAAKIALGKHYVDDGFGTEASACIIRFEHSRFRRTFVGDSGIRWGEPWDQDGKWVEVA